MDIGLSIGYRDAQNLSSIPFEYDSNTLWWDFTFSGNTTETTGSDTYSFVPERIVGVHNLEQNVKDAQALVDANGAEFNDQTVREMYVDDLTGLTNATDGWYFAANINVESSVSQLFNIARNASQVASRGEIQVPSNRQFGIKMSNNDSGTINWVARGPALTLATWYTVEIQLDLNNPAVVTIWYNGVEQTLAFQNLSGITMTEFPSTDPIEIIAGNKSVASPNESFDGVVQQMIFQNGVPSSAIRTSISNYLKGQKP